MGGGGEGEGILMEWDPMGKGKKEREGRKRDVFYLSEGWRCSVSSIELLPLKFFISSWLKASAILVIAWFVVAMSHSIDATK